MSRDETLGGAAWVFIWKLNPCKKETEIKETLESMRIRQKCKVLLLPISKPWECFFFFSEFFLKKTATRQIKKTERQKKRTRKKIKKVRLELFEYTFSYSNEYTRTVGV